MAAFAQNASQPNDRMRCLTSKFVSIAGRCCQHFSIEIEFTENNQNMYFKLEFTVIDSEFISLRRNVYANIANILRVDAKHKAVVWSIFIDASK